MSFSSAVPGMTGSTGLTPQYSGSLFGTPPQFDLNPLTNPNMNQEMFNAARLQGAGIPGVVNPDASPDQANWDAFWPKGMNLVNFFSCDLTRSLSGIYFSIIWMSTSRMRILQWQRGQRILLCRLLVG